DLFGRRALFHRIIAALAVGAAHRLLRLRVFACVGARRQVLATPAEGGKRQEAGGNEDPRADPIKAHGTVLVSCHPGFGGWDTGKRSTGAQISMLVSILPTRVTRRTRRKIDGSKLRRPLRLAAASIILLSYKRMVND